MNITLAVPIKYRDMQKSSIINMKWYALFTCDAETKPLRMQANTGNI